MIDELPMPKRGVRMLHEFWLEHVYDQVWLANFLGSIQDSMVQGAQVALQPDDVHWFI
jgi:hypothetical protein